MQLVYNGKKEISQIEAQIAASIIQDFSIVPKFTGLLFHADNFVAMANLLQNYQNMIDLVYIDPPFNTQLLFYYSQDRVSHISSTSDDLLAYSDRMNFEDYLEYLRERLFLVWNLLSPQGTLYFHIDTKVGHYLKIILDEIFGSTNFINDITRVKSNPKNFKRKAFGNQKDVIYIYAKEPGKNIFNDIKETLSQEDILSLYPKVDQSGCNYTTVPCHAPGETKNGSTGSIWRGQSPPPGRHWRTSPAQLDELDKKGQIEWSRNHVPRLKKYARDHQGKKIQDVWLDFKDPPYPVYPTEKNMAMLEQIVRQSSNPDSLVLDAFCGSGSFLAAAIRHGRRPIGIDCAEVAIQVAKSRPELLRVPVIPLKCA